MARSARELSVAAVAWDAWRRAHGDPAGVEARRQRRLGLLIDHAREHSRFYAERYRDLPPGVELRRLPAVSKSELMDRLDDWVTDPAVTRPAVEAFVADRRVAHASGAGPMLARGARQAAIFATGGHFLPRQWSRDGCGCSGGGSGAGFS
jgi:hypothetical protein